MVIDHTHREYQKRLDAIGKNKYNGAYYYSREICEYMIPGVKTDRNWITVNIPNVGCDHSIVFVHNNLHPEHYDWLGKYNDLVLVCGVPETVQKVKKLGMAIYLPLSVKVSEIEPHKAQKTREVCFAGRRGKRYNIPFPPETDFLEGMPRDELLSKMAKYKRAYAVGRTAIEAKVLGCEVLPYDDRFPDVELWQVIDTSEAVKMLQTQLNLIGGR